MGGMWLGWLLVIAVLAALIWLVARAASNAGRRGGSQDGGRTPEQILKERYARGEIDREEYEQRLADLRR